VPQCRSGITSGYPRHCHRVAHAQEQAPGTSSEAASRDQTETETAPASRLR
jgi:hypothetical protein